MSSKVCSISLLCFISSQLTLKDGKKKESIQQPRFDYYNMGQGDEDEDVDLTEDELSHIVEIYDFPADFKTEDLLKAFQCYQCVALGCHEIILFVKFAEFRSSFILILFILLFFLKKKRI